MFGSNNSRVMGNTRQGEADQGPPGKLANIAEARFFGIKFYDNEGRAQTAIVMEFGDQYYMPPNAIEWANALRPCTKQLSEQIRARLEPPRKAEVSSTDAVEVD